MSVEIRKFPQYPYHMTCSQPYKTDSTSDMKYIVNSFRDKRKITKKTNNFPDRQSADDFFTKHDNKWIVDNLDIEGNFCGNVIFEDEKSAMDYYNKNNPNPTPETDDLDIEIYSTMDLPELSEEEMLLLSPEEQLIRRQELAEIRESETTYMKKASESLGSARQMIENLATLYIDPSVLQSFPYLEDKIRYEEQSISMITHQLLIAQLVLKKYYKTLITHPSAKNVESLAKIQKTILELSEAQRKSLNESEKAFKNLKEEYESGKFYTDIVDQEAQEMEDDSNLVATNDRKRLIREIQDITVEIDQEYDMSIYEETVEE